MKNWAYNTTSNSGDLHKPRQEVFGTLKYTHYSINTLASLNAACYAINPSTGADFMGLWKPKPT